MKKYIFGWVLVVLMGCHSNHNHSHDNGNNPSSGNVSKEDHTDEILFSREQAEAVGLQTERIAPSSFSQVIKTSGQIQVPQGDEVTLAATTHGIVSFVNSSITEGSAVKRGEAIVTISARNLLDGDPAAIAQITYETARKELQRAESLVKDQIISAKEYEQARLQYETAKTAYEAQAGNITPQGVRVTTPMGGFIKNRLVSEGEYVSVGQPIATISQSSKLQLRAEVSEKYFKQLKSIRSANFKTSYDTAVYQLDNMNGRLLSFGKASDPVSFYIPVIFEFDNIGDVLPGSFVEVYLLGNTMNDVVSVPVRALTEEQGLYFVYLRIGEEEFKKQEVKPGADNGDRVMITSGLVAGDQVVTKGVYQVKLAANSSVMPEGHTH